MSQAGVVDADVHAAVLLFDSGEHGHDLFLVRQVALERQQDATEAFAKALWRQFLEWKQMPLIYFLFFIQKTKTCFISGNSEMLPILTV